MAHVREMNAWRRLWFFPWVERRWVGLYLDTAPNTPVDVGAFWHEYRRAKRH